jgi:hypothetical protein
VESLTMVQGRVAFIYDIVLESGEKERLTFI